MDIVWLLVVVLLIAWVLGAFIVPVGGSLIHLLLVVLVVVVLVKLIRGERI
jgi:Family of unknown function (DUF5670)